MVRGVARFTYDESVLPLAERELIARLRRFSFDRRRLRRAERVITGIGDDASVLRVPAGHEILLTTDFSLEGVHFKREWHRAEVVGHRCLARGLSDIAAMGGEPLAAFLSLGLPRELKQGWVDEFMRGLLKLARRCGVQLAGGDTAQSPGGILADIVVLGSAPRGKAILRSGAYPGDRIYVSGELGASAAAVELLYAGKRLPLALDRRKAAPEPRIAIGKILRQKRLASAMIDLSDGLSTDLAHICEESGVGAEIAEQSIPRASLGRAARVSLDHALHGGEDYELLFTSAKQVPSKIAGVRITEIGRITRARKITLISESGSRLTLRAAGWEHFCPSGAHRKRLPR